MMERLLLSTSRSKKQAHQRVASEPMPLFSHTTGQRIAPYPPQEQQKQHNRSRSGIVFTEESLRACKHSRSATATAVMMREDVEEPVFLSMRTDDNPFGGASTEKQDQNENISQADTEPKVPQEPSLTAEKGQDDAISAVSSISNDSIKRYSNAENKAPPKVAESPADGAIAVVVDNPIVPKETRDPPPPQEIDVPLTCTTRIVPEWLLNADNKGGSPASPIDAKEGKPQGHSTGHCHSRTLSTGTYIPRPTLRRNTSAPVFRESERATVPTTAAITPKPADVLIGDRPRRKHQRGPSLAFSVGSLVGQSSYLTEPTAQSSLSPSSADSVTQHHHLLLSAKHHRRVQSGQLQTLQSCQSFASASQPPQIVQDTLETEKPPRTRRRNPVKQEMLYVLGKVTKPVKKLVRSNSGKVRRCDLRRSNGMLT